MVGYGYDAIGFISCTGAARGRSFVALSWQPQVALCLRCCRQTQLQLRLAPDMPTVSWHGACGMLVQAQCSNVPCKW